MQFGNQDPSNDNNQPDNEEEEWRHCEFLGEGRFTVVTIFLRQTPTVLHIPIREHQTSYLPCAKLDHPLTYTYS
jgi:hypothetical protein